ncbi:MAG: N-formylglutamate amidohydrolase [Bradymonadaceae bacterium]|nr:N-formylglutamate amidohydrolase [Lujinxingiaceae bacterium]
MQSHSIAHIADVHVVRGLEADASAAPDLLMEIPHGATETADFLELAAHMESPLPEGLCDFFHVNTDVGAFELALKTAEYLVEMAPTRSVVLVRSRIPRTFIDCNRRMDASPEAFREGRVTPGLMPWIVAQSDRALLRDRYDAYMDAVKTAAAGLSPNGAVLLLHTYSPRSVDVQVDEDIVKNLRRAYEPEIEPSWPLRPEIDVICRDSEGRDHAPRELLEALRKELAALDWPLSEGSTYPLHPSTMAWDHVMERPGRALCLEVRRDLLADPFDPFVQMHIGAEKIERVARALARALGQWS